jgi:hypothetical protein
MRVAQAQTDCRQCDFEFQGLGSRKVVADFSGGHLSSDGGALLLRELDEKLELCQRLSTCFTDLRDQRYVEHQLPVLIRQRIHALALGYEDINDHERLRHDPLLAASCGREDLLGERRHLAQDKGKPLAGKSTLNRLELGAKEREGHYRKIQANEEQIEELLLECGVEAIRPKNGVIVLDFDATDDPIHGEQEGRFFHGYYKNYCYLPLYCFSEDIPLWAELRPSNQDASAGTKQALEKILRAIRKRFGQEVVVIVRGDSGFCREELMSWIEAQPNVHYCFGLARNRRLQKLLDPSFEALLEELLDPELVLCSRAAGASRLPECEDEETGRRFAELRYQTRTSWSRERRVVGKAEITKGQRNPRFIVTDITGEEQWASAEEGLCTGRGLYEKFYCGRGDMENRIKEQQLDMFADRTSTKHMASNQLRLWFSTFAYYLVSRLRAVGLKGTRLAKATVGTIRLHLMKIAAQLTVSVRRVYIRLASACPMAEVFAEAHCNLRQLPRYG